MTKHAKFTIFICQEPMKFFRKFQSSLRALLLGRVCVQLLGLLLLWQTAKISAQSGKFQVDNQFDIIKSSLLTKMLSNQPTTLSFKEITFDALPNSGMGSHCTVFSDATGDNLPDLYVTMYFFGQNTIADIFYVNHTGTVFDTSQAAFRGIRDVDGGSHGAIFADFDNDGDYDLINGGSINWLVPGTSGICNDLYENDGSGYFTKITPADFMSRLEKTRATLSFDMDNDGDLDIFSVSGFQGTNEDPPDYNEVYRNEGHMIFTPILSGWLYEVSAGQGATDTDYDGDGDIDIITANRTGLLNILQNDGTGHFTPISTTSIMDIVNGAGDGITMGDIDNDGDLDMLLVSEGPPSEAFLYRNNGDGTFLFDRRWGEINGYMGGFADLDNDGDLDLVFAGHTHCYLNNGSGSFVDSVNIPIQSIVDPRSIAFADIDNDGDIDFSVSDKRSQVRLIRNDLNNGNNWLKVRLTSSKGQAGAFGAKVRVCPVDYADDQVLGFREARSCNGYLAQNDPVLHFGLGYYSCVDVSVVFLDSTTAFYSQVLANQTIDIDTLDISLQAKIFLEGPYDTDSHEMSTALCQSQLIPLTSPYTDDSRSVTEIPPDVVDWVLVQLRRHPGSPAVLSRSVFLRNDGRIVDDDGEHDIELDVLDGQYHVIVKHRNHLSVMSSAPVVFETAVQSVIDFTAGGNMFFGDNGAKELEPGIWGMIGGNADSGDQDIYASDLAFIKCENLRNGYRFSDVNMDGTVQESDYTLCKINMLAGFHSAVSY